MKLAATCLRLKRWRNRINVQQNGSSGCLRRGVANEARAGQADNRQGHLCLSLPGSPQSERLKIWTGNALAKSAPRSR